MFHSYHTTKSTWEKPFFLEKLISGGFYLYNVKFTFCFLISFTLIFIVTIFILLFIRTVIYYVIYLYNINWTYNRQRILNYDSNKCKYIKHHFSHLHILFLDEKKLFTSHNLFSIIIFFLKCFQSSLQIIMIFIELKCIKLYLFIIYYFLFLYII